MHNDVPPFIFVFCLKKRAMCVVLVALSVVLIQNELNKFGTQYITNSICRWWSRTFRLFFFALLLDFFFGWANPSDNIQIKSLLCVNSARRFFFSRAAFWVVDQCLWSRRIKELKRITISHHHFSTSDTTCWIENRDRAVRVILLF